MKIHNWNKISEPRIKKLNVDKPIFVQGTREMSEKRISQLVKGFATQKNVIWGVLKDEYIPGLEDSPQFKSLKTEDLIAAIEKEGTDISQKIQVVEYFGRDLKYLLDELKFSMIIFVNGSWHRMLHLLPEYWQTVNSKTPYKLISPFSSEEEAVEYTKMVQESFSDEFESDKKYSEQELIEIGNKVAKRSFDWVYQTGCVLAESGKVLLSAHNEVVPYEAYSMHFGSIREKNFSPPNDQNHYDTNHAEINLLIKAQKSNLDLKGSTLYINLMPCPTCARMISKTDIAEVVYVHDHSDGYAVKLFEKSRIKVRRLVI